MQTKFLIFLLLFAVVASFGCIESKKLPSPNEIATPAISTPEPKLPVYNETKPLKINDSFTTWSRGYYAKDDGNDKPHFILITNYNRWIEFLNEQGYFSGGLDGRLFPGEKGVPETIKPDDFDNYFIIAAMMGLKGITEGPEIEIMNISRINNTVNVTTRMYEPTAGAAALSSPYHIVIVKRESLPVGNSIFIFTDTDGKKLGELEAKI